MDAFISSPLHKIWKNIGQPDMLWEFGTIFFSMFLGWMLAQLVQRMITSIPDGKIWARLKRNSFARFLATLFSLTLAIISKLVLANWQDTHLLHAAVMLLLVMCMIRLLFFLLQPVVTKTGSVGHFLQIMERIFSILVLSWFALYITGLWPELVKYLQGREIVIGVSKISLMTVAQAATSIVVLLVAAIWGSAIFERNLMRMQNVHSSMRVAMSRIVRAVLVLVAVLISLSAVGINLTVLSVFGGALGVGLGFGLQKIASNYVSGFIILFDRSLEIGDMIEVDKYYGEVTQINTRFSVLRGLDGVESVIPNEMLVSSAVKNHSLSDEHVWVHTDVSVSYQTDVEPLLRLLEEVVSQVPRVSRISRPVAYLHKFGADGLELRIGFHHSDPENGSWSILSDVNRAIWRTLQEQNVEIPYPQRVVRVINERPSDLVQDW